MVLRLLSVTVGVSVPKSYRNEVTTVTSAPDPSPPGHTAWPELPPWFGAQDLACFTTQPVSEHRRFGNDSRKREAERGLHLSRIVSK